MSSSNIPKDIEMYYDFNYQLSTYIFDYRMKNNLSKTELARILGVTRNTESRLESGDYNGTLSKLCNMLSRIDTKIIITVK